MHTPRGEQADEWVFALFFLRMCGLFCFGLLWHGKQG